MKPASEGPNAEMIRYWNEQSGPKWVQLAPRLDAQIGPLGLAAMERAGIGPGERVLDVGCGCGETTLQLAERVGTAGAVTGVDVSGPMLARARERASELGLANVSFLHADAQGARLGGPFDAIFSRFGVMFFADPPAAFANLAAHLRPGGRMVFVCWQALKSNPWMAVPLAAAARFFELPAPPDPCAPGPFAFADRRRVLDLLEGAGLGDASCEPLEGELLVGGSGDLDDTADFAVQMGPLGAALREADESTRAKAREAVREALVPYAGEAGVRVAYAAWIAYARRPGPER